jgi:hypothetical protein
VVSRIDASKAAGHDPSPVGAVAAATAHVAPSQGRSDRESEKGGGDQPDQNRFSGHGSLLRVLPQLSLTAPEVAIYPYALDDGMTSF